MSKIIIKGNSGEKRDLPSGPKDYILKVAEFFSQTIQGEGITTGVPAAFLRVKDCTLDCHWCFLPDSKVHTKHKGIIPIEQVEEGDILITLDINGGIVETSVKKTMISKVSSNSIGCLRLDRRNNNRIYATQDHLFQVKGKGWVKLQDIQEGDILFSLKENQYKSYQMKHKNPSSDPDILKKSISTQKQKRLDGEIVAYERSEDVRKLSSERMSKNNPSFDADIHRKSTENRLYNPSKLELRYQELFQNLNYEMIKYVGSQSKKAIGSKEKRYRFPDFIIEEQNKIIEIYDTTMHYSSYKSERKKRDQNWENQTREFYSHFGYEVLFLTQEDIKSKNRKQLLEKLFCFLFNGVKVSQVDYVISKKQKARLWGSGEDREEVEVYNLSCDPYNTYLVEGCLVHNCDSSEVWRTGNPYTIDELFKLMEENGLIDELREGTHLVLTGGSPLKQQKTLANMLALFQVKYGFLPYIEVENEVMLAPDPQFSQFVSQWNNSPKLENSKMKKTLRYKPAIIAQMSTFPNSIFKFVVSSEEDWKEIKEDFLDQKLIDKSQIILMPCGANREELDQTRHIAVDIAIREGVMYSDRLHIILWDLQTGV